MRPFVLLSLFIFTLSCNAANTNAKRTLPVNTVAEKALADSKKAEAALKKEEDCDDKAKKPIEIKEETISLSGNTGCSLDEIKK